MWLHRPPAPEAGIQWTRDLVEDVLRASGCPGPTTSITGTPTGYRVVAAQIEQLAAAALEPAAQSSLRYFARSVVDGGGLGSALRHACNALGEPSRDDVRGLVAQLFPDELALHERIREDAGVLGAEAILQREPRPPPPRTRTRRR